MFNKHISPISKVDAKHLLHPKGDKGYLLGQINVKSDINVNTAKCQTQKKTQIKSK